MELTVRAFARTDAEAFLHLHRACLRHYSLAPATNEQEKRVLACLVAERHMSCHLAFDGVSPVGFTTWGLNFPAGPGVSLVMKELFVVRDARKSGVGRALISSLVDVARAEDCERFDWATDYDNTGAQKFYTGLGATTHEKQNYRVARAEYDAFQARLMRLA